MSGVKKTENKKNNKKIHYILENELSLLTNKNVIYIGCYVDVIKIKKFGKVENIYIWGKSHGIILNELREKQEMFYGFEILFITECENNVLVEKLFELKIKQIGLTCSPVSPNSNALFENIKNKNKTFLNVFKLNDIYTIHHVITIMKQLVVKNKMAKINTNNIRGVTLDDVLHPYYNKEYSLCSIEYNHKLDKIIRDNFKIKHYIKIGEECSICMDPIWSYKNAILMECGHGYHATCIYKYVSYNNNKNCPLCRQKMDLNYIYNIAHDVIRLMLSKIGTFE